MAATIPRAARAADECGAAPGGGLVICATGDYPGGISYDAGFNDLSVVVPEGSTLEGGLHLAGTANLSAFLKGVTVGTSADFDPGVWLATVDGDLNIDVQDITTTGASSAGVFATSDSGSITIVNGIKGHDGDITTLGVLSDGIHAYAGGDIGIASDSIHTFGDGSNGIHAVSSQGSVSISSTAIDTHGLAAAGIVAHAYSGLTINSGSIATNGKYGAGIVALADHGDVDITSQDIVTDGEYSTAIFARADDGALNITSGTISTSGHYSRGILAVAAQDLSIVSGDISTHSPSFEGDGILAYSHGALSVTAGDLDIYGQHSYALVGYGDKGVSIVTGDVNTSSANLAPGYFSSGIVGVSAYGPVAISTGAVKTGGFGIYARSDADAGVVVDAASVDTSGDYAFGIVARSVFAPGDVSVHVGDLATHGLQAFGIYASSDGGQVGIDFGSIETDGIVSLGVVGVGREFGNVVVTGDSVHTHGDYAGAISVQSYGGSIDIDVGSIATEGDYTRGVFTYDGHLKDFYTGVTKFGDTNIVIDRIETSGFASYGIFSIANAGNINVSVGDASTLGDYSTAIRLISTTVGDFLNPYTHAGNVVVDAGRVSTVGNYSDGIFADSTAGSVTIDAGDVSTQGDYSNGIVGKTEYTFKDGVLLSGDVNIHAGSVATDGAFANGIIGITYQADVDISAGDVDVAGYGSVGIVGISYDAGDVTLNLDGDVHAPGGAAVVVDAAGSATIDIGMSPALATTPAPMVIGGAGAIFVASRDGATINNNGTLAAASGLAIRAAGGGVRVNNFGAIVGYVDLSNRDDRIDNAGLWQAEGDSYFDRGYDAVFNSGLVSVGATASAPVRLRWFGLESFENSGVIGMANGRAGDVFDLRSAGFFGADGSTLAIDVGVNSAGRLTADKLIVGDASGSTSVVVQGDAALGSATIIDTVSSTANSFVLPGGRADAGLVSLRLAYDSATADWSLVGDPDTEAFEAVKLGAAAQGLWRRGSAAWAERMRWDGGSAGDEASVWGQYLDGEFDRDAVQGFDALGTHFAEDLSTESRWSGGQVGGDIHRGAWTWGGTAGYAEQTTTFTRDRNRLRLDGVNVGGYAGFKRNGFFAEGLVDYQQFHADIDLASAGVHEHVDGGQWGFDGVAGYRTGDAGFFVETSVGLAWSHAQLDDVHAAGATISYDGADSLEGRAGVRVGSRFGDGGTVFHPWFALYAIKEFSGENAMRFATGPTGFSAADRPAGSYGEATLGLNAELAKGMQVFASAEVDFGDVSGHNLQAGLRWQW